MKPLWPGAHCGRTVDGHPICYYRHEGSDPRKLMAVGEDKLRAFYVHWMELSLRHQATCNDQGTRSSEWMNTIEVHDLNGLSMSQLYMPGLRMLARTISIGQLYYP